MTCTFLLRKSICSAFIWARCQKHSWLSKTGNPAAFSQLGKSFLHLLLKQPGVWKSWSPRWGEIGEKNPYQQLILSSASFSSLALCDPHKFGQFLLCPRGSGTLLFPFLPPSSPLLWSEARSCWVIYQEQQGSTRNGTAQMERAQLGVLTQLLSTLTCSFGSICHFLSNDGRCSSSVSVPKAASPTELGSLWLTLAGTSCAEIHSCSLLLQGSQPPIKKFYHGLLLGSNTWYFKQKLSREPA